MAAKRATAAGQISSHWKAIYATPEGRQAIAELMVSLNLYSEIAPTDPMQAGIAIGERNVAARIARWVGKRPEDFIKHAVDDVELLDSIERAYRTTDDGRAPI